MAMQECLMPRCSRKVDDVWALCRECWTTLPEDLRYGITRAYMRGMEEMTVGLSKALTAAHSWVLATFGAEHKAHDPGLWERVVRLVRTRDEARAARRTATPATPTDTDGWA